MSGRWRLAAAFVLVTLSSYERWEVQAPTRDPGTPSGVPGAPGALGSLASLGPADALGAGEVELVFLANEGFLVRSREGAFVIDAFLETPLAPYAALPPQLHARLIAAEEPFDDVDLALVSHVHPDHFQPGPARAFLESSPGTRLATSPQVIESLESAQEDEPLGERLHPFLPEAGEVLAFEHAGIEVAFLRLAHSGNRPRIQNLGHLVRFGDLTILHVGDAEGDAAQFEPYGLAQVDIDVALLPYWYWSSAAGQRLVATQLAADTVVAIHVPPREVAATVEALAAAGSDVHVFRRPLESLVVKAD